MTKKEKIDEFLKSPIKVGERVHVCNKLVSSYSSNNNKQLCEVVDIVDDDHIGVVNRGEYSYDKHIYTIENKDAERDVMDIGANPFPHDDWHRRYRTYNYDINGIFWHVYGVFVGHREDDEKIEFKKSEYNIDGKPVCECNFNPYVYVDGEKKYYQRDYVWNLEDEQMLISSIYNHINCGNIVVRKHSWNYLEKRAKSGETELFFNDLVDGKQRMMTLFKFFNNEFTDEYGNFWRDLSDQAKLEFLGSRSFTFGELDEGCTDEDALKSFLSINFTGKPMSKEHIEYVKSLTK